MLIIIAGILIAAYPWISDYVYRNRVSDVIVQYDETVKNANAKELENLRRKAEKYNKNLRKETVNLYDPFNVKVTGSTLDNYKSLLSVNGSALMGYVSIPKINVNLPIYHGTSQMTLQAGIGHLEGTSLPIGGKGAHSVLTGHTGLSEKKMFTDLDQIESGDLFFIKILDETLCYKVSEINIVTPNDMSKLQIQEGKDLCTLITCTPYGINDHRLLVTGIRTEYAGGPEAPQKEKNYISRWRMEYLICILTGLAVAFVFIIVKKLFTNRRIKKNHEKEKNV